jgi:hypothetical protein
MITTFFSNKICLYSLAVGIGITLLPLSPVNARSNRCAASLQAGKNRIERIGNVRVVDILKENTTSRYKKYPKQRPDSYGFALEGAGLNSGMVSNKLLTNITANIIRNCPSVSAVQFGENRTDNTRIYGLVNNRIRGFLCVDRQQYSYQDIPWGYDVCN